MNRRDFLKGLISTAAAPIVLGPAIVKAESIMKIWTPPKEVIVTFSMYTTCFSDEYFVDAIVEETDEGAFYDAELYKNLLRSNNT